MTEPALIAQVAVEKTTPGFDKLYSYRIPPVLAEEAQPGCRVKVGFGHGTRQGMILRVEPGNPDGLKPIQSLIDREPVLPPDLLRAVPFMRERFYCTYFDAVAAMLPRGLSVKLTYACRLSEGPVPEGKTPEEQAVLKRLQKTGKPVLESRLMRDCALPDDRLLRSMARRGLLLREEQVKKTLADAAIRMVRLREIPANRPLTPAQQSLLQVVEDMGEVSVKELLYFTGHTRSVIDALVRSGVCEYFEAPPPPRAEPVPQEAPPAELRLTPAQQEAFDRLLQHYRSREPSGTLLYGVTGSGKTAVFLSLIDRVHEDGRGVICMVPEISLTPQLVRQFQQRYGDSVAVFHSAMSIGKRLEEWRRVKEGQADIVVGTRSAVFAPLENLGLIVMDEEQEYSYKSAASPRYHARELAKLRCTVSRCPAVFASATPSVESYYYARKKRYDLCVLPQRYGQAQLPVVTVADMNLEQQQGNMSGFSLVLQEAVQQRLEQKRQAILLLNRRGCHTFVTCRSCRTTMECPNCSITLNYHSANQRLMCHYCGYSLPLPKVCPSCHSDKLRFGGTGTQRAESELQELFPKARILRMDTDSTMRRYAYEQKLEAFRKGEYDILLGTQMVAKGLDFPNVTLVGVLQADAMLHSQDFRSYEKSFALLTQVVGRSGRGALEGQAIIQTFEPENPIIRLSARQDYEAFYQEEIRLRRQMLYPPFADMGVVVFSGEDRSLTLRGAEIFAQRLGACAAEDYADLPMRVMGPAPALVERVCGRYRFRLIIKYKNSARFRKLMEALLSEMDREKEYQLLTVYFDPDPETVM